MITYLTRTLCRTEKCFIRFFPDSECNSLCPKCTVKAAKQLVLLRRMNLKDLRTSIIEAVKQRDGREIA